MQSEDRVTGKADKLAETIDRNSTNSYDMAIPELFADFVCRDEMNDSNLLADSVQQVADKV